MKIKLTILILLVANLSFGQNFSFKEIIKNRFYHGIESQLDLSIYPSQNINHQNSFVTNQWESGGLNLGYFFRFNILELSDNQSFSIGSHPMLGFRYGVNRQRNRWDLGYYRDIKGYGSLHLPFTFNYHIGKGATRNSTYRYGVTLSFGPEFRIDPLVYHSDLPKERFGNKRNYKGNLARISLQREKKRLHQFFIQSVLYDWYNYSNFPSFWFASYSTGYGSYNFSIGMRFFSK